MRLDNKATTRAQATYEGLENAYNDLHNSKYDYSKAIYLNSKTKMCIMCPIHGEFWQTHNKHYSQKQGCPVCAGKLRKSVEKFVEEAKEIHGSRYDYSKVVYKNQYAKVTIICPEHGEFEQSPTNHLAGKICHKCAITSRGISNRLTYKDFLRRASKVHNSKYTYSNYIKADADVTIICPIHGSFIQQATHHMAGQGCPKCGKYGFQPNESAILYYLKINNGIAYKVGITNRSVQERFQANELNKIEKLFAVDFAVGKEAHATEQQILKLFKNRQYTGIDLLSSGNTELFDSDIFKDMEFDSANTLKEFLDQLPQNR